MQVLLQEALGKKYWAGRYLSKLNLLTKLRIHAQVYLLGG